MLKFKKLMLIPLFLLAFSIVSNSVLASDGWVEIKYCQNIVSNTWYRLTADIYFNNATLYNHVCLAKHQNDIISNPVGYDTTNITIDMNGYAYYPNSSYSSSPFVYWRGAGLRLLNGTINGSLTSAMGYSIEYGATISATVENITSTGGYYGLIFTGNSESSLGVVNSIFTGNTYDLAIVNMASNQLYSCNVTWVTKVSNSAELSNLPCGVTPNVTTTTISGLERSANQTAFMLNNGINWVSYAVGVGVGSDMTGGRFIIWFALSSIVTVLVVCSPLFFKGSSPLGWQFGAITFVAMFLLGTVLNFVPLLITILFAVVTALVVGKFGADIFAGGG